MHILNRRAVNLTSKLLTNFDRSETNSLIKSYQSNQFNFIKVNFIGVYFVIYFYGKEFGRINDRPLDHQRADRNILSLIISPEIGKLNSI